MIIRCTQCDTRFKVADEKLKPSGIKVRCSKCRNIFTVMPPEPEKPAPPPEPPMENEIDFGDFNMKPLPEEPAGPVPETDGTQGEEVGQARGIFAAEPPAKGPVVEFDFGKEFATGGGASEFGFGDKTPAEQGPSEFDFGDEAPARQGPSESDFEDETTAEQGPSEFDFEEEPASDEGAGFDFEEESPSDQDPQEFGFEDESSGSMEFSFDENDPFPDTAEESWESEKGAGAPEDFDFGDGTEQSAEVDDFDLSRMTFGEEESPAAPPAEDFGSIPLEQAPEMEQIVAPAEPKAGKPSSGAKKKAAVIPAAPRRRSPFKGLLTFVLLLLLALSGAAAYFFWQRGELDIAKIVEQLTGQGTPAAVAGQIRVNDLSSSFVTNRETGQLFVIQGKAVNNYSETRSAIAVKGVLYNGKGKPLLQQTVFCGNSMTPEALRTLPFAKIEENMNNQFGDSLSNLNVGPGKAISFTIVFKNLPSDLAEYTVEVADSKPGSKP